MNGQHARVNGQRARVNGRPTRPSGQNKSAASKDGRGARWGW
jgi:hypothetical protein